MGSAEAMARIQFKAKPETIYNIDDSVAYVRIQVPKLERRHCDMDAFRRHPRYGSYANSDLFSGILAKMRRDFFGITGVLRLDRIPDGVQVDTSGFLAVVTWDV
jgi:hypothetical protein